MDHLEPSTPDEHKQVGQAGGAAAPGSGGIATQEAGDSQMWQSLHVPADGLHAGSQAKWSGLWPGRQIHDPKYCPQGPVADGGSATARARQGSPQSAASTTGRGGAPETPMWVVFPHHCPIWVFLFFVLFFYMSECYQLRVWGKGVKAIARCMWGGGSLPGWLRHQVSQRKQTFGPNLLG